MVQVSAGAAPVPAVAPSTQPSASATPVPTAVAPTTKAAVPEKHASPELPSPELRVPRIEEWYFTSLNEVVGHIYGKEGFIDGEDFHTSAIPIERQFATHVIGGSGTVYWLGAEATRRRRQPKTRAVKATPVQQPPCSNYLIAVRTGEDIGPGLDDEADYGVEEHEEEFLFGGYVCFEIEFTEGGRPHMVSQFLSSQFISQFHTTHTAHFRSLLLTTAHHTPHHHAPPCTTAHSCSLPLTIQPPPLTTLHRFLQVRDYHPCTPQNIDHIESLLPQALWADRIATASLKLASACPWGRPVFPSLPLVQVMVLQGGDYDGEPIRVHHSLLTTRHHHSPPCTNAHNRSPPLTTTHYRSRLPLITTHHHTTPHQTTAH